MVEMRGNRGIDREVRIGIMGGTFDPIHIGHTAAAEAAFEAFQLDEVVFLPAGRPSFKLDRDVLDANERLVLCEFAVRDYPEFSVSPIEVERPGVTYTVDSLRQLQEQYGPEAQLYFILGTDSALTLPEWYEAEELAKLATFAVIKRPWTEAPETLQTDLEEYGFSTVFLNVDTPAISSTEVRELIAKGESIHGLVDNEVEAYIRDHGLYAGGSANKAAQAADEEPDVLSGAFYQARYQELVDRVSEKRLAHIMGVSKTAEELACVYGVDVDKARLAGLLHDWDKGYNDEGIRARADELGMDVDPFVYEKLPRVLHAHTAAVALGRDFPQIPADVLQAIDRHTIAATDMTPLDMVIYIADAIEPTRKHPQAAEIRKMVGSVDLEELFICVYEYWIIALLERRMQVHPQTAEIWNHYAALLPKNRGDKK